MPEVIFKIKNLDKLQKGFAKAPKLVKSALGAILKKSSFLVERESKKLTPVDTGRLRASIFTTILPFKAIVQPKTNYAIFVHEGTKFMRGRPFMQQGLDKAKSQIDRIINKEINQVLKKI